MKVARGYLGYWACGSFTLWNTVASTLNEFCLTASGCISVVYVIVAFDADQLRLPVINCGVVAPGKERHRLLILIAKQIAEVDAVHDW